ECHAEKNCAPPEAEGRAEQRDGQHAVANEAPRADAVAEKAARELAEGVGREVRGVDGAERGLAHPEVVAQRLFRHAEAFAPEIVSGVGEPGDAVRDIAIGTALGHGGGYYIRPRRAILRSIRCASFRSPARIRRLCARSVAPRCWWAWIITAI